MNPAEMEQKLFRTLEPDLDNASVGSRLMTSQFRPEHSGRFFVYDGHAVSLRRVKASGHFCTVFHRLRGSRA